MRLLNSAACREFSNCSRPTCLLLFKFLFNCKAFVQLGVIVQKYIAKLNRVFLLVSPQKLYFMCWLLMLWFMTLMVKNVYFTSECLMLNWLDYHFIHFVHYAHAAANLNSRYSEYAKVARMHYFCTIALRIDPRSTDASIWASAAQGWFTPA